MLGGYECVIHVYILQRKTKKQTCCLHIPFLAGFFEEKFQLIIDLRNLGGCVGLQCCYQFALKFRFPLITFSLVNRFTSYSQTLLLRSRPFHQHAVCSIVTFSLVDRFTHTQNCFVRDLYTDMPHCDLQMTLTLNHLNYFLLTKDLAMYFFNMSIQDFLGFRFFAPQSTDADIDNQGFTIGPLFPSMPS